MGSFSTNSFNFSLIGPWSTNRSPYIQIARAIAVPRSGKGSERNEKVVISVVFHNYQKKASGANAMKMGGRGVHLRHAVERL